MGRQLPLPVVGQPRWMPSALVVEELGGPWWTLPALVAGIILLVVAVGSLIRRGRRDAHRAAMLVALGLSAAFLTSYLVYHFNVGSVRFSGEGWVRRVYLGSSFGDGVTSTFAAPTRSGESVPGVWASIRGDTRTHAMTTSMSEHFMPQMCTCDGKACQYACVE